jgi:UDP-glucose 4-epimerase
MRSVCKADPVPVSLVTGGAGFIGSHVAENLVRTGHRVVVLDDLSGGFVENVPHGAESRHGSVLDHRLVDALFDEFRFEFVFHLAAYAAEGLSHFIRRFNYSDNIVGSVNLINAAINSESVRRFVFTSSIAVYGAGESPLDETMTPVPEDPYGIAKLAIEHDLRCAHEIFGLDYTIFRPHNVYGERQNIGDRYRNVVGILMNQALRGEPMTIFGDGTQQRAFTHVADVAPLIAESVGNEAACNEIFNVGAEVPFTVNDLATEVSQAMGVSRRVIHLPARNEVHVAFSSHAKSARVFGAKAKVSLSDGIRAMAQWVKRHGARESSTFDAIEIEKKLPPSWKAAITRR